jgi:23S rRNA (adenine2503-C2)-methyltransferase
LADKIDIRSIPLSELTEQFVAAEQKPFRAKQVHEWLWKKGARTFDEMTNLSIELRHWLNENYNLHLVNVLTSQTSADGTIKLAFKLHDDAIVDCLCK